MSLLRLICPAFFLYIATIASHACAQPKEIGETVETTKEAMNAKTDSVYFEAIKAKMKNDEQLAVQLFERFSALRPEVPDALYELSKLSYNNKQLDKAEVYIKQAIALSPDNKWYKEEYASILADRGDYMAAGKIMGDLSSSEPQDATYLMVAAEYYERAKKYEESLSYLDKAIEKTGPDEELLQLKKQVYLSMNKVEKAADVVRQLIAQDPRNGKYYRLLGDIYENNKLPEKAAAVYEQAEKVIPGDPYVQSGRAEHFLGMGDTAQYIKYVNKVILNKELDAEMQMNMLGDLIHTLPNDSEARAVGLPLVRQLVSQHPADAQIIAIWGDFLDISNRPDSAAWAYNRSLQIKSSVEVWRKLVINFIRRQEGDSAIKSSEKFIRLYPNQVDPYYYNARAHFIKKEYDKAIKAINRAIDHQPENNKPELANLYAEMGDIYHTNKQDDLADKAFDKALSLDPDNATTLNNFAYYLSERGKRLEDAERMSKRSLDIKPGEATFLDTYGWILYRKGDYEKAKLFVKRAIDIYGAGADGTLFDHLGDIYSRLNNKDKAIENWKLAKEKGADDKNIDKKISEGKLYE